MIVQGVAQHAVGALVATWVMSSVAATSTETGFSISVHLSKMTPQVLRSYLLLESRPKEFATTVKNAFSLFGKGAH